MSTKKYIDGTKGLIDTLLTPAPITEVKKVAVEPIVDIDPDIERKLHSYKRQILPKRLKK